MDVLERFYRSKAAYKSNNASRLAKREYETAGIGVKKYLEIIKKNLLEKEKEEAARHFMKHKCFPLNNENSEKVHQLNAVSIVLRKLPQRK